MVYIKIPCKEQVNILLSVRSSSEIEQIVDDLTVANEAKRDVRRVGRKNEKTLFEQTVAHFLVDQFRVLLQKLFALLIGIAINVSSNELNGFLVKFCSHSSLQKKFFLKRKKLFFLACLFLILSKEMAVIIKMI